MATITRQQYDELAEAIRVHDFLHRLQREIEQLHYLVFHANREADWSRVRESALQILIAEIALRHHGEFDGVYQALRAMEREGREWRLALREMAGRVHSYYTTPLGISMRADLFGDGVVFISPAADTYVRERAASSSPS